MCVLTAYRFQKMSHNPLLMHTGTHKIMKEAIISQQLLLDASIWRIILSERQSVLYYVLGSDWSKLEIHESSKLTWYLILTRGDVDCK